MQIGDKKTLLKEQAVRWGPAEEAVAVSCSTLRAGAVGSGRRGWTPTGRVRVPRPKVVRGPRDRRALHAVQVLGAVAHAVDHRVAREGLAGAALHAAVVQARHVRAAAVDTSAYSYTGLGIDLQRTPQWPVTRSVKDHGTRT